MLYIKFNEISISPNKKPVRYNVAAEKLSMLFYHMLVFENIHVF